MKKRVLALILVLALFVCLFSVSALAAFDKAGTPTAKIQKAPPGTTFYWIVPDRQIGCRIGPVANEWHGGGEHLTVCTSYRYVEETDTWYYYGPMLKDTSGMEIFAW